MLPIQLKLRIVIPSGGLMCFNGQKKGREEEVGFPTLAEVVISNGGT